MGPVSLIGHLHRTGDDVSLLKHAVEQSHLNMAHLVQKSYLQSVCRVLVPVEHRGQGVQLIFSPDNPVVSGLSVKRVAAVTVYHLDAGCAEISLLLCGEFLGLGVQGEGAGVPGLVGIAGKAPVVLHDLVAHIRVLYGGAVIKMEKIVQVADLHLV